MFMYVCIKVEKGEDREGLLLCTLKATCLHRAHTV